MAFLFAAIGYVALTFFIYFNYPKQWRENRSFMALLILWHIVGLSAVVAIFTMFKNIRYENIRYEITRIGTCYYITTTLQAILFFIRAVSSRTYSFIARRTGTPVSEQGKRWISNKRVHAVFITALSFCIFAVGYFNIDFLQDTRYEVNVSAPSRQEDLTICLIADIHAGSGTWEYSYDDLVTLIDSADADVLLIAGDLFDETTGYADVDNFCWTLKEISRPKYGIYLVYGNHDGILEDWVLEMLHETGVTILQDEMTIIGEDIQLIGCLDTKLHAKGLDALLEDCAPDPNKPILILTHRPKYFQQMAEKGCDLVMAGHTHGFCIPQFCGSALFGDMYAGIKEYGEMTAVTTSGVSAWGFHYKWPAVSEVVTIHVTFTGGHAE